MGSDSLRSGPGSPQPTAGETTGPGAGCDQHWLGGSLLLRNGSSNPQKCVSATTTSTSINLSLQEVFASFAQNDLAP